MATFDPYRKWLGIPAEDQPPHYYRLLGIGLFESDSDVIANAADRQMVHVRSFQTGKYADLSQKILNELAAARVCLLDPQKRATYDATLKSKLAAAVSAVPTASSPPHNAPPPGPPPKSVPQRPVTPSPVVPIRTAVSSTRSYPIHRRKTNWQAPVIVVGILAVAILGITLMLVLDHAKPNGANGTATPGRSALEPPGQLPELGRNWPPPADQTARTTKKPEKDLFGMPSGRQTDPMSGFPSFGQFRLGEISALEGHSGPVLSTHFSPDGLFAISGGEDKTVRLWDIAGGRELRQFRGSADTILASDFSSEGRRVVALAGQGEATGGTLHIWETGLGGSPTSIPVAEGRQVHSLALAPEGEQAAVGCRDGTIRLIDLGRQEEVRSFSGHDGAVHGLAFSPDGTALLSAGEDGNVLAFNRKTGTEVRRFSEHRGPVRAVAVSPDGREAASAGDDHLVRLWDLRGNKLRGELRGHEQPVTGVAFSPLGERAVSAGRDGKLLVWQVRELREDRRFDVDGGPILAVATAPDGKRAVTAGQDGVVRLWGLVPPSVSDKMTAPDAPDPEQNDQRAAVPKEDDQRQWRERIRKEMFPDDFEDARQPDSKIALAEKLLGRARDSQETPAATYAFFDLALQLASEAGDAELALGTVDEMTEQYAVDGPAMKLELLQGMADESRDTAARSALVATVLNAVDDAAAQERFDVAEQLLGLARSTMGTARDTAMNHSLDVANERLSAARQAFEAIESVREKLRDDPQDPDAALAVGKYECFVKGNWKAGLPMLANGADEQLAQIANTELAEPDNAQKQLALADDWWQRADAESGRAQEQIRWHAVTWYKRAEPRLEGAIRDEVRGRILASSEPGSLTAPGGTPPEVDGLAACRTDENRAALLRHFGGDVQTESAVHAALQWLAAHQFPEGYWNFNHQGPQGRNPSADPGTLEAAPNAATAMALLPFLGAGHGPRRGEFRRNVSAGLNFLRMRMVRIGPEAATLFEPKAGLMPSHAIATCALCEALAMAPDAQTRTAAQVTVRFILDTQDSDGGWAYKPTLPNQRPEPSSLFAAAWNLRALKTAQWAGLKVPETKLKLAESYLDTMRLADGSGFRRAPGDSRADPTATAVGILSQMYLGCTREQPELTRFVAAASERGPAMQGQFYQDFCTAQILRDFGGHAWTGFNTALRSHLLETQADEGPEKGSWYVDTSAWSNRQGGRVFCTAMAALILETYYRQPSLLPKTEK